jgi:choline monooxygenase
MLAMTLKPRVSDEVIMSEVDKAGTIPSRYYTDPALYQLAQDRIFARSWQFATDTDRMKTPGQVVSWNLCEGSLNEPLMLTRDNDDKVHCLSNVCTHRGAVLVEADCHLKQIRCRYHGRRFSLDGQFQSAPGFEDVCNFPAPSDNLPSAPIETWEKFIFGSLSPAFSLDDLIGEMKERVGFLPLKDCYLSKKDTRDYVVNANWALYCDNYLEGLHVPYIHPSLTQLLDTKNYTTELQPLAVLQVGGAANPCDAFDLPKEHPDFGKSIAAYYYFLFPNMMWNFYPWGLSINLVLPMSVDKTRIKFITYIWDESRMAQYSPQDIDRTEREDEAVVELVQKGVSSRLYDRGRYSKHWEEGVHHFHAWLVKALGG